jgi:dihydrofolate reductase
MLISLIAAMDQEGGIGRGGQVPWHLRADLQRFKRLTLGHPVIMGRKTFASIGRALPGRTNIVITRQRSFQAADCQVASSFDRALELAVQTGADEAIVIGGGEIYAQALPKASRLYLTVVDTRADCDVFFPLFDLAEWLEIERIETPTDEKNQYASTFCILERIPTF